MSGFSANAFLETAEAQGAEIQGGFGVYDDLRYQPAGDRSDAEAVTAEARGYDQPPVLVEPVDDRQHIGGGGSQGGRPRRVPPSTCPGPRIQLTNSR